MKRRELLIVGLAFVGFTTLAIAADVNGTWKWTVTRGDQKFDQVLKLKLEGDKLTGVMLGRDNQETKIDEAKFKDGEISFAVTREFNNQKRTTKYKGKVDGDTIKGTTERERDGKAQSDPWEAKREKPSA